jgi:hypothetical protein
MEFYTHLEERDTTVVQVVALLQVREVAAAEAVFIATAAELAQAVLLLLGTLVY